MGPERTSLFWEINICVSPGSLPVVCRWERYMLMLPLRVVCRRGVWLCARRTNNRVAPRAFRNTLSTIALSLSL